MERGVKKMVAKPLMYQYPTRYLQERVSQELYEMIIQSATEYNTTIQDFVLFCILKEMQERNDLSAIPVAILPESGSSALPLVRSLYINSDNDFKQKAESDLLKIQ